MSTANIGRTKRKRPALALPECPDPTEQIEMTASAPVVVHHYKDPKQVIDVADTSSSRGARQDDPDEALAVLQELATFVIARLEPQGKTIVITIPEEDVDELNLLLDRDKSAI